ncbi:MAG: putative drug exporter of the superfamily, partial [Actinomycetota bacterium]
MLARLAGVLMRRRRIVRWSAVLFVVVAAVLGGGVEKRLSSGGFEDPNAESTKAGDLLREDFGQQDPNLVMVLTAKQGSVDDPANARAGLELTNRLASEKYISFAGSYWSLGQAPPLKSTDGTEAMLLARIKGSDDDVDDIVPTILASYDKDSGPLKVSITGMGPVFREVGETIKADLGRA